MIFYKILFYQMKNVIEVKISMEPLLLRILRRDFPPNRELFLDVKLKNGDIG